MYAGPSLERIRRPGDEVLVLRDQSSIFEAYNRVFDEARRHPDLEAVVLLHEDVELHDLGNALALLSEPAVGVVGAVGGIGHPTMGWWTGRAVGYAPDSAAPLNSALGGGTHEVDTVDGLLLAFSPWAARSLRFDTEIYHGFHGYDADICSQLRSRGRKVMVGELDLFHHRTGGSGTDPSYRRAALTWILRWGDLSLPRRLVNRVRLFALGGPWHVRSARGKGR